MFESAGKKLFDAAFSFSFPRGSFLELTCVSKPVDDPEDGVDITKQVYIFFAHWRGSNPRMVVFAFCDRFELHGEDHLKFRVGLGSPSAKHETCAMRTLTQSQCAKPAKHWSAVLDRR